MSKLLDLYAYLVKNNIDNTVINTIIMEESDLESYNVSINELQYLKEARNLIQDSFLQIFEDGELDNLVTKLHSSLKGSGKSLDKWEREFIQISDTERKNSLKKLFDDRADFMRDAKKTLETVFTNCCYSFRLNNLNYQYSYSVKQYSKTKMSNSAQLSKLLKTVSETQPSAELSSARLKEQMINLRVAKKWMTGKDEDDKIYKQKIESLIKIYDCARNITGIASEVAKTGFINPLSSACEAYA